MSKRQLPAIHIGALASTSADLSTQALARWDETITAKAAGSDNTISILGVIGEDIFGEGVTIKRISAALRSIGPKDVVVNINSPGGNYFEGLAIYNALREHDGEVTVRVLGVAASAASLIAMAGDRIEVAKAGFLMIHNSNLIDGGDRHDKRDIADKLEQFDAAMVSLYAARTGLSEKEIGAMMDEETFLDGAVAVEKKFADALLSSDEVDHQPRSEITALRRLDDALAKGDRLPRAERRKLLKEISERTPGAASDLVMPGADDEADGLAHLRIAAMKLSLTRA
jgi:ATP-dependent protease ClpP protease subunit